jgi:hypothetical protein
MSHFFNFTADDLVLVIPHEWTGKFIGRGGCFAREMRTCHQVAYHIQENAAADTSYVYVSGRGKATVKRILEDMAGSMVERQPWTCPTMVAKQNRVAKHMVAKQSRVVKQSRVPERMSSAEFPRLNTASVVYAKPPIPSAPVKRVRFQSPPATKSTSAAAAKIPATFVLEHMRTLLNHEDDEILHPTIKKLFAEYVSERLAKEYQKTFGVSVSNCPSTSKNGTPLNSTQFRDVFGKFGDVVEMTKTGTTFIVKFTTKAAAQAIVKTIDGNKIEGVVVSVKFC